MLLRVFKVKWRALYLPTITKETHLPTIGPSVKNQKMPNIVDTQKIQSLVNIAHTCLFVNENILHRVM